MSGADSQHPGHPYPAELLGDHFLPGHCSRLPAIPAARCSAPSPSNPPSGPCLNVYDPDISNVYDSLLREARRHRWIRASSDPTGHRRCNNPDISESVILPGNVTLENLGVKQGVVSQRQLIVGVVGGDGQMRLAEELGREIALRGWILLTGGQLLDRSVVEPRGEVKDASMLGAAEGGGSAARLVGIIPGSAVEWRRPLTRRLFLNTGLSHNIRNVINGRTPDILVAFGGSRGTLAEIAFAKAARREVIFYTALERLRNNFKKYFGIGSPHTHRETYIEEPLRTYPQASGAGGTASSLIDLLAQTLTEGREANCDVATLANQIERAARPDYFTGFPGLPGDSNSKDTFQTIIEEISK